jgi:(p)ppGpp synthase/HD superfamily hydrolase
MNPTESTADDKFSKLSEAFAFAAFEHRQQLRKSTDIPYISHLMSVSALIMEHGGDMDQAIAGLFHDIIEDANPPTRIPYIRSEILSRFGERVLGLVEGCTDGEPNHEGKKPAWKQRKEAYLSRLEGKPEDLLLVSCCDKLHNARAILTDALTHGDKVFDRFTASKEETIWYYGRLADVFTRRLLNPRGKVAARELSDVVTRLRDLA